MDSPYYIRNTVNTMRGTEYEIYRTGDGHVATAHDFTTARMIVEALNKLELERAMKRAA